MKNRVLLITAFILLILVSCVSALEVELTSPGHMSVYEISNTINFKCKVTGENLVQLALYTDISGTREQTGDVISSPNNNTEYTFTIDSVPDGTHTWNCEVLSSSDPYHAEAPSDRQVIVSFLNDPPIFSGPIPNQTWNQDESKNNAFDLDTYFSDVDSITYSVSTTSNININIASDNQVSFSQPPGWWGTETVTFTATDVAGSIPSNQVTLTVNQGSTPGNQEPTISNVPDQTKEIDDTWTINLDEYIDDDEDSDSELTISVSGVDTSVFTVSIDQDDNELDFEAVDEGNDDFTITVEDTDGATDSETITVTIEEEGTTTDDDEFDDDEFSVDITKASPATSRTIIIKPGEEKIFEITTNTYDIIWYVDNKKVEEKSRSFTFKPLTADIGDHIIKVIAGTSTDKDMKTWDIIVEGNETKTIDSGLCGNNKINTNETCLNCPEDVSCEQGEYCDEGTCKKKTLTKVTGLFTTSKDFILDKWYYPTLILGIILLITITTIIIRMNKKPKSDDPLEQFSEKTTFWKKIQRKLREWDRKKTLKKQNKDNLKKLEQAKKEHIRATAPSVDSIKTFIKQRLNEGNKKREIIKALKKNGWSRKHIKIAFKQLKNDSTKPA